MPKYAYFTLSLLLYNCTSFNQDYANCMHFSHWYTNDVYAVTITQSLAHRGSRCSSLLWKAAHHNHFLHVQALAHCIPVPGILCHHHRTLSRKWPLTSWTSLHGLHSAIETNTLIKWWVWGSSSLAIQESLDISTWTFCYGAVTLSQPTTRAALLVVWCSAASLIQSSTKSTCLRAGAFNPSGPAASTWGKPTMWWLRLGYESYRVN